jgi:hypothetical protein
MPRESVRMRSAPARPAEGDGPVPWGCDQQQGEAMAAEKRPSRSQCSRSRPRSAAPQAAGHAARVRHPRPGHRPGHLPLTRRGRPRRVRPAPARILSCTTGLPSRCPPTHGSFAPGSRLARSSEVNTPGHDSGKPWTNLIASYEISGPVLPNDAASPRRGTQSRQPPRARGRHLGPLRHRTGAPSPVPTSALTPLGRRLRASVLSPAGFRSNARTGNPAGNRTVLTRD